MNESHSPVASPSPHEELGELMEALCEQRIRPAELARLEALVLADRSAAQHYLSYIHLHGSLLWDTAKGGDALPVEHPELATTNGRAAPLAPSKRATPVTKSRCTANWALAIAAAFMAVGLGWLWQPWRGSTGDAVAHPDWIRPIDPQPSSSDRTSVAAVAGHSTSTGSPAVVVDAGHSRRPVVPVPPIDAPRNPDTVSPEPSAPAIAEQPEPRHAPRDVVAFIDEHLKAGWDAAEVAPSPRAEDGEWLRRVHLDFVGRIPAADVTEGFLANRDPRKHERAIEELLDDPQFARNWTTVWTNLLVGRSVSKDSQRAGLQKFLRESFAHNRPWKDVVFDLVSAEGSAEDNGASGFLLAHLNNEAVPATAITARVFLGMQVQCTQCHCHPFNDWQQNQFWELNSFFQQTARVDQEARDPLTGKTVRRPALVNREAGGPTFFETRRGLMLAAFPRYEETQVDPAPTVNRRRELARLMIDSDAHQVARSMVNRTWEHFFGAGFTRPVDDMGPHNPPTHPAVLDRLTAEFVASGYDVKQLVRWICGTRAYQLSSRFGDSNADDNPALGNAPLFSRVYVKSMSAEQLFDSLLVATRAHEAPKAIRLDLDRQRDEWIQQFIVDYGTEENDEALTFDGTIPQALLMMNSELVSTAVSANPGTLLHGVVRVKGTEAEKIRELCLAALSRYPTPKESAALRKALRDRAARASRAQDRDTLVAEGLQDIFWALLNSNEFVLNH